MEIIRVFSVVVIVIVLVRDGESWFRVVIVKSREVKVLGGCFRSRFIDFSDLVNVRYEEKEIVNIV